MEQLSIFENGIYNKETNTFIMTKPQKVTSKHFNINEIIAYMNKLGFRTTRDREIKPEEIKMVLDMITTTLDDPTFPDKQYMIDFNKIIPEPKNESECPDEYKVNKTSHIELLKDKPWFDWYKWRINHWGTKWGAYDRLY